MHCHSSLPNDLRPGGIGRCADCATRFACIGSGLATEPLRRLATLLSRSERLLPGSHLYRPGDAADYQFHVRTGTIKTYVLSANGDERVTGFYLAGEVLSNSQIEGARTEGAVALETATVCRLRIKDIGRLEEIDRLPALMLKMAQQDTRRG